MFAFWIRCLDQTPRRVLALLALACLGMLGFALYLQHSGGLTPCPMCIVQRYALTAVMLCAALACVRRGRYWRMAWAALALLCAGFGAFVAARQSWLQWYPPESYSCGRDFYGMIENYSFSRAMPMIFRGSGDCMAVDWTLLGGTIANWSFACFVALAVVLAHLLLRRGGQPQGGRG